MMVQRKENVEDYDTWKEEGIKGEKRGRQREECRKFEREKKRKRREEERREKRERREKTCETLKAKRETSDFGIGIKLEV